MLGISHAASGALTGLAAAEVTHLPATGAVTLAALTAGFVTLSDLDSCGSCAARSLGFMSEGFAHGVRFISGGPPSPPPRLGRCPRFPRGPRAGLPLPRGAVREGCPRRGPGPRH